ncbi:hypothetical protein [Billgrantia bachuensis]|uniref:Uncharacterized protein n=1 Tax=Billgrantia bachuensis TaxID=2717286 RepID=A0ABX0PMY6_9GAMM|nr:hypothetical protein [Halomonas bachuensis]NIC03970.1 hypothetical protein [Halomonas bachuensis]
MTPARQIITAEGLVFVALGTHYTVDTAALADEGVVFVGEHNGARWIEREPFTGRVTDIPADLGARIDAAFADADQQHEAALAAAVEPTA